MKKQVTELKKKSVPDLEKQVQDLRSEMAKLKLEYRVNPPKDSNKLMKKRKLLAVLLTILGEKLELEKINIKSQNIKN